MSTQAWALILAAVVAVTAVLGTWLGIYLWRRRRVRRSPEWRARNRITPLAPWNTSEGVMSGRVCPYCRRTYGAYALFCSDDGEALDPVFAVGTTPAERAMLPGSGAGRAAGPAASGLAGAGADRLVGPGGDVGTAGGAPRSSAAGSGRGPSTGRHGAIGGAGRSGSRRGGAAAAEAAAGEGTGPRVCPTCGTRFDFDRQRCDRDGTALLLVN